MRRVQLLANIMNGFLLASQMVGAAQVMPQQQTVSGLPGWLIKGDAIEIQLNPLTPDQVRAFYLARGFANEITELIAQNCVYQLVANNISLESKPSRVSIDLSDWHLTDQRGETNLVTKQDWLEQWSEMGASQSARIAFEWATFPWQQDFELTGDEAWGMLLFGPVVGDSFNLIIGWQVDGKQVQQKLDQLICPQNLL